MLTPQARIYLAVNDTEAYERLLDGDARFFLLGGSGEGARVRREAADFKPDCVLMDMALSGADGLSLMAEWRNGMASPPRVLLLCPYGEEWQSRAAAAGADRMTEPGEDGLADLLWETANLPLPALAAPWAQERRKIAEGLVNRLGVSRSLKGRPYIIEAAAALCCAPQLARPLAGKMYPYLAETFHASQSAVERAIRTAVESTWLTGDLEEIQALFGLSVDPDKGKPTNGEFLSMLAVHARRQMKQILLERNG